MKDPTTNEKFFRLGVVLLGFGSLNVQSATPAQSVLLCEASASGEQITLNVDTQQRVADLILSDRTVHLVALEKVRSTSGEVIFRYSETESGGVNERVTTRRFFRFNQDAAHLIYIEHDPATLLIEARCTLVDGDQHNRRTTDLK
jgi:hypothetical protein